MTSSRTIVLSGSQHPVPQVGSVLRELRVKGPVAVVVAGWQEREKDDVFVPEVDLPMVNLTLHARAEDIFARDVELGAAYKERQTRLRSMQDFYRVRLDHASEAARTISLRRVDASLLAEEEKASFEIIRRLDRDHVERCSAVHAAFDARFPLAERKSVVTHRRELAELIAPTDAILIAGGHVAVLLNRLKMFDLLSLIGGRKIIAWSAGAMTLSELVVLFHDDPPNGEGRSEVLDRGLGLVPNLIVLPDPRRRLKLDDAERVRNLAQRFLPCRCATLDQGARIVTEGGKITSTSGVQELLPNGTVERMRP